MDSNKNNPVISIITPYFNGQDYIEETAKSVLRQIKVIFASKRAKTVLL